jgi:uncharacterized protein (DUF1800 family)
MVSSKELALENAVLGKLANGFDPSERANYRKLGLKAWLNDQLNPKKPENEFVRLAMANFLASNLSLAQTAKTFPYSAKNSLVTDELVQTTVLRRLYSSRQTFETLVEFFSDLIPVSSTVYSISRIQYDRDVIRAHALGNYPDMLLASSRAPGMLYYLNGATNTRSHPNENYGREILELFTVSTKFPYTQDDVVTAAKVFSGIGWSRTTMSLTVDPKKHYRGPVSLLGWSNANPGTTPAEILATSESMIRHLALLPATAHAFSYRLARRYVSDTPSEELVASMAKVYLKTKGHIPSVVKTMAFSSEFAASGGAKLKRPSEYLVSTVRALGLRLSGPIQSGDPTAATYFAGSPLKSVQQQLSIQGHEPFKWPFPNGYPDVADAWTTMTGQIQRWNLSSTLAQGLKGSGFSTVDYHSMLPPTATTPETITTALATRIFGAPLEPDDHKAVVALVSKANVSQSGSDNISVWASTATSLFFARPEWNLR